MEMTDDPKLKTTAGNKRVRIRDHDGTIALTHEPHYIRQTVSTKKEDSPQKRAKIAVEAPLKKEPDGPRRSSQFYYSDGTIVVIVGDVEYSLHLLRLMKYFSLFSDLYRSDQAQQSEQHAALDTDTMSENDHLQAVDSTEIPRYEIKNITVADFTAFLCAFENPLYVHN